MMRAEALGSKIEQYRSTMATVSIASSLAKKTEGSSTADTNRACSNRRSRKNEYNNSMPKSTGRVCTSQPIYYGYEQGVVATTCWNGTCSMLTSAKLSVGYLVVGITRELDKEPSLHCLPYLSKLQMVCATTICLPHVYSAVTVQDCAFCPNVYVSYMW